MKTRRSKITNALLLSTGLVLPLLLVTAAKAQQSGCMISGNNPAPEISSTVRIIREPGFLAANVVSDFTLDSFPDVIIANQNGNSTKFSIYEQLGGTGEFRPLPSGFYTASSGQYQLGSPGISPHSVFIEDLDQNLFLDVRLVTRNAESGAFNTGTNSFVINPTFRSTGSPFPFTPMLATELSVDINADTRLDRISVVDAQTLRVELQQANGTFQQVQDIAYPDQMSGFGLNTSLGLLPLVDLDNDGKLDVVALKNEYVSFPTGDSYASAIGTLLNTGSGMLSLQLQPVAGYVTFDKYLKVSGDDYQDIVFRFVSSTLSGAPASQDRPHIDGVALLIRAPSTTSIDRNGNSIRDTCERAIPGDFDRDRRTDITVARPLGGLITWLSRLSGGSNTGLPGNQTAEPFHEQYQASLGLADLDQPLPGDFDGDGRYEPAVVRGVRTNFFGGLFWFNLTENGSAMMTPWGLSGDLPLAGHFDADITTDRAVVRNAAGGMYWFIRRSTGEQALGIPWGLTGDRPYAADLTGDGISDLLVARVIGNQVYWFLRTVDGTFTATVPWGLRGDNLMAPFDYDGDGRADLAVYRTVGRLIYVYIRYANGTTTAVQLGLTGDAPYTGYFDSEARANIAMYRAGAITDGPIPLSSHFIYHPTPNLISSTQWGFGADKLIRSDGTAISFP